MPRVIKSLLFGLVLLTACGATAPTLDQTDAQTKTASFLTEALSDPETTYTGTSERFQSNSTLEDFQTFVDTNLKGYTDFSVTGLSYQQGVGINATKVDGDLTYSDLTSKNASFIWSYNNATKAWTLDALRFN